MDIKAGKGAATVPGVIAGLIMILASGCAGGTYEPEPLEVQAASKPRKELRSPATASSTPVPTTSTTPQPIDVCAKLPAARVQQVLRLPAASKVRQSASASACTYTWPHGKDETGVVMAALPDVGRDPKGTLEAILGPKAEPVGGVGDLAGVDRSGRYGFGSVMFAAVRKTDRGIYSVTVAGRSSLGIEIYRGLAKELLRRL